MFYDYSLSNCKKLKLKHDTSITIFYRWCNVYLNCSMDCPNELIINNDKLCHFFLSSYWSSNKQYQTVGIFVLGQLVIFFPVIINEPSTFRRKTLVATIRRSRDFDIYDRSHFLISYHDRIRFVDDRRRFVDSRM